jgi:hypothetical protein
MNSRLISEAVSGDLSATCLSCNPPTINRRRETLGCTPNSRPVHTRPCKPSLLKTIYETDPAVC